LENDLDGLELGDLPRFQKKDQGGVSQIDCDVTEQEEQNCVQCRHQKMKDVIAQTGNSMDEAEIGCALSPHEEFASEEARDVPYPYKVLSGGINDESEGDGYS